MVIDIRGLLKDELATRQKRNPRYSLRAFAQALEMSPAQLSQLLSGRRNLTLKMFGKICDKLSLSPMEKENLIRGWSLGNFTFADTATAQERKLQEDEFKLIADWHHMAILSLARVRGASTQPKWIADRLGISEADAKEAVARLQRLNILAAGLKLQQISAPLSVISETPSAAIRGYHRGILHKAEDALESVDVARRDYSAMTLTLNPKHLHRYRKLIEKFQHEVVELGGTDPAQEVYVLSSQLFPVQKQTKGEA